LPTAKHIAGQMEKKSESLIYLLSITKGRQLLKELMVVPSKGGRVNLIKNFPSKSKD